MSLIQMKKFCLLFTSLVRTNCVFNFLAEEEYRNLNSQYHDLLLQIGKGADSTDAQLTSKLKDILQLIEKKGKQLSYLKTYQQTVEKHIHDAASPPRIRGVHKRQKTLQLFRDIKNLHMST